MFKFLFPTLMLAAAISIFYFFTDPTYQDTKALKLEGKSYVDALDNSKKLLAVRDQLRDKYNGIPQTQIDRLERMVPNNVDNVRLVLEIDRMAAKYGMSIKSIKLSKENVSKEKDLIGKNDKAYGTLGLEFSVDGPYHNFTSFVSDLEKNLRIVDIDGISFSSGSGEGVIQFGVRIRTYWLR